MKYTIGLTLASLLLCGCSSEESTTNNDNNTNVLTTSGASCETSSSSNTNTSTNNQSTASSDAICQADLEGPIPGPGISNTGTGTLLIDGISLPVKTMIFESIFTSNTESIVELTLHDGEYRSLVRTAINGTSTTTRTDYGTYNASVYLSMELVQAGTDGLTGGSFEVFGNDNSSVSDAPANRAPDVFFFQDKNGDKKPTSTDEVSEGMTGNINISGTAPNWTITLDLTLENGSILTGNYSGEFYTAGTE